MLEGELVFLLALIIKKTELMDKTIKIALVQMHASADIYKNIKKIETFFVSAKEKNPDLIVFPENCLALGKNKAVRNAAESLDIQLLHTMCEKYKIAAVFGGIPVKTDNKILNRSLFIENNGETLGQYDKINLFFLDTGEKIIDERKIYTQGDKPVTLNWHGIKIGLSICYDLRFPELYYHYLGCDLILCTAAFTYQTGEAHWHTLLKARAIENQCFVAGVNQVGENEENSIKMFAGTSIYNAWGNKIADCANTEQILIAELDFKENIIFRNKIPSLRDRIKSHI